jgi:pyridoxamine 5'-phosphate oxidase
MKSVDLTAANASQAPARPAFPHVEYTRGALTRQELSDNPIEQFARWFADASGAGVLQPEAMSLSTVSPEGQPSLRTVLMKAFDERGFVFFTNLQSRKARELRQNPRVALMFPWLALERQVIVTGTTQRVSMTEAMKYFLSRSRGSRLSAWVSPQSRVIESRKALEMEWERMSHKFARGEVPLPSFWGGYRVTPVQIEFWQGRANRLHDRFLYTRTDDGRWTIEQLAP